jgi:hypothetical protein
VGPRATQGELFLMSTAGGNTSFGAQLDLGTSSTQAADLKSKIAGLRAAVVEMAAAMSEGEIDTQQWAEAVKPLNQQLREMERAERVLDAAAREVASALEEEDAAIREMVAAANAAEQATLDLAAAKRAEKAAGDLAGLEAQVRAELDLASATEREAEAQRLARAEHAAGNSDELARRIELEQRLAGAIERQAAEASKAANSERQLRSALDSVESEMLQLGAAFDRGEVSQAEYIAQTRMMDSEVQQLRGQLGGLGTAERVEAGAADAAAAAKVRQQKATDALGQSSRRTQMAATQFAYALQDATSVSGNAAQVIQATSNNLQMMAVNAGIGAGAVIGLTVAVAAVQIAAKNWESLTKAIGAVQPFRDALGEIEALDKRVKELTENKHRFTFELDELDEAQRKLDHLKKGLAEYEAQKNRQTSEEAESGKMVQEHLDRAEGGAEGVQERLVQQREQEIVRGMIGPQAALEKEIQGQIAALKERQKSALTADEAQSIMSSLVAAQHDLVDTRNKFNERLAGASLQARQEIGDTIRIAREGHGGEQRAQQRNLAARLARTGDNRIETTRDKLTGHDIESGQFDSAADLEAYDREAEDFQRSMDRAKAAGERRREKASLAKKAQNEADKAVKETLTDELNVLKASGEIDDAAKRISEQVKAEGLKGAAAIAAAGKRIDAAIRGMLAAGGYAAPAGREAAVNEAIGDLSVQAARGARIAGETEQRKATAAAGRAQAKGEKGEAKTDEAAFEAQAARVLGSFDAEAKRIRAAFEKAALEQLQQAIAANPLIPAEEIAQKFGAMLAVQFRQQGARAGGANTAAQEILAKAGFEVPLGEIAGQPPRGPLAQREGFRSIPVAPIAAAVAFPGAGGTAGPAVPAEGGGLPGGRRRRRPRTVEDRIAAARARRAAKADAALARRSAAKQRKVTRARPIRNLPGIVIPREKPIAPARLAGQQAGIDAQTAKQAQRQRAQQAKIEAARQADQRRRDAAQARQAAVVRGQQPDTVGPQAAATNAAGLNAAGQQAAATAALQRTLRQQQLAYDAVAKRLNQITRSIQSDQGTAQNSGTQVS